MKLNKKALAIKIGCNLLHHHFVEEVLVKNYKYPRRDGIDYTTILKDEFLKEAFNIDNKLIGEESLISNDKLITITYGTLDKLDILLMMDIEDLNFKEILFKGEDKEDYLFEVVY